MLRANLFKGILTFDDVARLFDDDGIAPEEAVRRFHAWGTRLVCLTLGTAGSTAAIKLGQVGPLSEAIAPETLYRDCEPGEV